MLESNTQQQKTPATISVVGVKESSGVCTKYSSTTFGNVPRTTYRADTILSPRVNESRNTLMTYEESDLPTSTQHLDRASIVDQMAVAEQYRSSIVSRQNGDK